MNNFVKKFNKNFIILTAIFMVALVGYSILNDTSNNEINSNSDNIIKITPDLSNDEIYEIIGNILYYPNKSYNPDELLEADDYEIFYFDDTNNFFNGNYATLVFKIDNSTNVDVRMDIPKIHNPYKIFLNEDRVDSGDESYFGYNTDKADNYINIPKNELSTVTINLYRDNLFFMGFYEPIEISSIPASINQQYFSIVGIGMLLIATIIYTLLMFQFYKMDEEVNNRQTTLFMILFGITLIISIVYDLVFFHLNLLTVSTLIDYKVIIFSNIAMVMLVCSTIINYFSRTQLAKRITIVFVSMVIMFTVFIVFSTSNQSQNLYIIQFLLSGIFISLTLYSNYRNTSKISIYNVGYNVIFYVILVFYIFSMIKIESLNNNFFNIFIFIIFTNLLLIFSYQTFTKRSLQYSNIVDNLENEIDKRTMLLTNEQHRLMNKLEEMKESEAKLLELATKDHLTKLYNRHYAMDRLEDLFTMYMSTNNAFSVIIMDIDNFKYINDTYGHDMGDITLKIVSSTITSVVRETDFVIRWGGEEFLVVMETTDLSGAIYVAEKIRQSVENAYIEGIGNVTISLGVSEISGVGSIDEMINEADEYLLKAKKMGKNCVFPKMS